MKQKKITLEMNIKTKAIITETKDSYEITFDNPFIQSNGFLKIKKG